MILQWNERGLSSTTASSSRTSRVRGSDHGRDDSPQGGGAPQGRCGLKPRRKKARLGSADSALENGWACSADAKHQFGGFEHRGLPRVVRADQQADPGQPFHSELAEGAEVVNPQGGHHAGDSRQKRGRLLRRPVAVDGVLYHQHPRCSSNERGRRGLGPVSCEDSRSERRGLLPQVAVAWGPCYSGPRSAPEEDARMEKVLNYIGGELVPPGSQVWLEKPDPATGSPPSRCRTRTTRTSSAPWRPPAEAFPAWAATPAAERARLLRRVADAIRARPRRLRPRRVDRHRQAARAWPPRWTSPRASSTSSSSPTRPRSSPASAHPMDGAALNYTLRQPLGRGGLHLAVEPAALPAHLEDRPRAGGGQHAWWPSPPRSRR